MKKLQNLFFSILIVGLLFACSKKENHDDLLRKIMVQHMESQKNLKGLPFKDTVNENGDIFFGIETEAEHYNLQGNYKHKDDYLVFNLYFNYWDGVAEGPLTAIYKNGGSGWSSVFQEPLVDGSLDTIIDLNNDKVDEIIMKVRTSGSRGKDPCDRLVLYGQKTSALLEEVGVLAERINSEWKLVKDYSLNYEPGSEGIVIAVKSEEGTDLESDSPRKTSTQRFKWEPPVLVDLNKSESDYPQVKIGDQTWMTTNLEVTTFRNGDTIPFAGTEEEWRIAGEKQQPAWCRYDTGYSKWYNWYAVNDSRGLAPKGWHIASDEEWHQLFDTIGGEESAIPKIKSKEGWAPNENGTNESGFTALPAGTFDGTREFSCGIGILAQWWSSSEGSSKGAWSWSFSSDKNKVNRFNSEKNQGLSVRCIKDN